MEIPKVFIQSIQQLAKKFFVLLLVFLSFLFSCQVKENWQSSTILIFDTVCEIKIFCSSPAFKLAQKEILSMFSEIEEHFSPGVHEYSSPLVLNLFHRALEVHRNSNGCFDVTVAPLSRAWGFLNSSHRVPAAQEIKAILKNIGMEKIQEEDRSLLLLPGMELDWGGIAKGFGIDLASQALIKMGISRGFINAGGDLYCWGENPDYQPWKIGIKHPRKSGFFGVLSISDLGAATTGDYQRCFELNNIRYHHILNPGTGYPAQGKQSVTVVGPETLICDALSTALFVSKQPEEILESYTEYGAVIVDVDGKISLLGKTYPFRPSE